MCWKPWADGPERKAYRVSGKETEQVSVNLSPLLHAGPNSDDVTWNVIQMWCHHISKLHQPLQQTDWILSGHTERSTGKNHELNSVGCIFCICQVLVKTDCLSRQGKPGMAAYYKGDSPRAGPNTRQRASWKHRIAWICLISCRLNGLGPLPTQMQNRCSFMSLVVPGPPKKKYNL